MKSFQTILLVVFIVFGVVGTLMFAGIIPTPSRDNPDEIEADLLVWGTLPERAMDRVFAEVKKVDKRFSINYVEKRGETFELELLRAVSSGVGPDVVIYPNSLLLTIEDSIFPVTFETFSRRDFSNTFVEGSELFLTSNSILGLPLVVDPFITYWNRDIFNEERVTTVPQTWGEILNFGTIASKSDPRGKIVQSAVALGESGNIRHSKDILSLLLMQAGDTIVEREADGTLVATLGNAEGSGPTSAASALSYYTGFSDPVKRHYSWNSSLPVSFDAFAQGSLAIYFGPSSEYASVQSKNPNLNFDVAPIPQLENTKEVTYGTFYGASVLNSTRKVSEAFSFVYLITLTDPTIPPLFAEAFSMAPAQRGLLSNPSAEGIDELTYDQAIISRAWLDPNPQETSSLFSEMVRDVSQGIRSVEAALFNARGSLQALIR